MNEATKTRVDRDIEKTKCELIQVNVSTMCTEAKYKYEAALHRHIEGKIELQDLHALAETYFAAIENLETANRRLNEFE